MHKHFTNYIKKYASAMFLEMSKQYHYSAAQLSNRSTVTFWRMARMWRL